MTATVGRQRRTSRKGGHRSNPSQNRICASLILDGISNLCGSKGIQNFQFPVAVSIVAMHSTGGAFMPMGIENGEEEASFSVVSMSVVHPSSCSSSSFKFPEPLLLHLPAPSRPSNPLFLLFLVPVSDDQEGADSMFASGEARLESMTPEEWVSHFLPSYTLPTAASRPARLLSACLPLDPSMVALRRSAKKRHSHGCSARPAPCLFDRLSLVLSPVRVVATVPLPAGGQVPMAAETTRPPVQALSLELDRADHQLGFSGVELHTGLTMFVGSTKPLSRDVHTEDCIHRVKPAPPCLLKNALSLGLPEEGNLAEGEPREGCVVFCFWTVQQGGQAHRYANGTLPRHPRSDGGGGSVRGSQSQSGSPSRSSSSESEEEELGWQAEAESEASKFWMEGVENYRCPLCLMACDSFQALSIHLTACHSQLLHFKFTPSSSGVHVGGDGATGCSRWLASLAVPRVDVYLKPSTALPDVSVAEEWRHKGMNGDATQSADSSEGIVFFRKRVRWRVATASAEDTALVPFSARVLPPLPGNGDSALLNPETGQGPPRSKDIREHSSSSEARPAMLVQREAALAVRPYFHSRSAQLLTRESLNCGCADGDGMPDARVLDTEDKRLLEEYVHVPAGEKLFMHWWNSFARRHRVMADGHLTWAVHAFAQVRGCQMAASSDLRRQFMLFLVKLWTNHLIDGSTMQDCLSSVDHVSNQLKSARGM